MITQYRPAYYDNPRASTLSGLSTDQKPTDVENGARYEEIDTGKTFCFDKENKAWYEMPQSGGGGSSVSVEPITITKNGVTTAPDGVAYSPITTDTYTQDGDKITITEDDGSMVVFTQGEVQPSVYVTLHSGDIGRQREVIPGANYSAMKKCVVGLDLLTQQPEAPSNWTFTAYGSSISVEGPDGYYEQGVKTKYSFPDGVAGAFRKISTMLFVAQNFENPLIPTIEEIMNGRETMPLGLGFTIDGNMQLIWFDVTATIDMEKGIIVTTLTGAKDTSAGMIDVKITWTYSMGGDDVTYNLVVDKFEVNGVDRKSEITETTSVKVVELATLDYIDYLEG